MIITDYNAWHCTETTGNNYFLKNEFTLTNKLLHNEVKIFIRNSYTLITDILNIHSSLVKVRSVVTITI